MPETMTWITYHKTYHSAPVVNTSMSSFIFQKDTVLRGFLFNWEEKKKSVEEGDATITAQADEQGRAEVITSAKPYYQIDSMLPGAKCIYCAQSQFDTHTTL